MRTIVHYLTLLQGDRLLRAASEGKLYELQILIKNGADVDQEDDVRYFFLPLFHPVSPML